MRPLSFLSGLGLTAALALGAASGASAGEGYGHGYGQGVYGAPTAYGASYGGGYGFADAAIGGGYVGAPYTRFPRPSEIVPPAWGYGTFGVPSFSGIRQAPTAQPTVYVIDAPARSAARRVPARSRILSRAPSGRWSDEAASGDPAPGAARIVSLTTGR